MNDVSMKFKDNINEAMPFYSESIVTFPDGTPPLTLVPGDFIGSQGFQISEYTSNLNIFDLGSVAIGQLTALLNNFDGRFDKYNFKGAVFSPTRVFTVLDDQTIEKVNKGKYTVDSQAFAGGIVSLVALNDINNFDTPYTGSFTEDTALNIVNSVALKHGLILSTQTFNNYNFHVTIPSDKKLTDRQVLNYIAQLTCNYVKLDENNYLKLGWYDVTLMNKLNTIYAGTFKNPSTDIVSAGTFTNMATNIISAGSFADLGKYHHITSLYDGYTVDLDDVVITGIKVINDSLDEFLSGSEGYILTIQNNPLTTGKEQIIADMVANICVGMRFRPLSAPTDCNPIVQSGDIGLVETDGNCYVTIFTNVEFNIGGNCTFSCGAESPGKNSSNRNTEATMAFLRAKTETVKQISTYDVAVKQMTNLIANAFGLHTTVIEQGDGSSIYYMHNKSTIALSSFVALANSNGFFIMKDGVPVSGWDTNGDIVTNVLTAIGINCEWLKVGTAFGGFTLNADTLSSTISKTFGPFTDADVTYIHQFIVPNSTVIPTAADILKYDITGDGKITLIDSIYIQRIILGADSPTVTGIFKIDPKSLRETLVIERLTGPGAGSKTALGAGSMYTNNFACDNAIISTGATGTFTSANGKTVTVTSGIITSIA